MHSFSAECDREEKNVHDHHRKKSFGELFLASKKNFQVGGGYKNPMKTKNHIYHRKSFLCGPRFFSAKKSSALEQGNVWFLFPSARGFLDLRRTSQGGPKRRVYVYVVPVSCSCFLKGLGTVRYRTNYLRVFEMVVLENDLSAPCGKQVVLTKIGKILIVHSSTYKNKDFAPQTRKSTKMAGVTQAK